MVGARNAFAQPMAVGATQRPGNVRLDKACKLSLTHTGCVSAFSTASHLCIPAVPCLCDLDKGREVGALA